MDGISAETTVSKQAATVLVARGHIAVAT